MIKKAVVSEQRESPAQHGIPPALAPRSRAICPVLEATTTTTRGRMGGRLAVSRKGKAVPPLYRIYHLGIEEIRMRVASDSQGGSNALSARSIQADSRRARRAAWCARPKG